MLVLILAAIVGFGTFFVIYSLKGGFASKSEGTANSQVASKPTGNPSSESSVKMIDSFKNEAIEAIESNSLESDEKTESSMDDSDIEQSIKYFEFEYGLSEKTSSINEIPLPKTPKKPNPIDFSGLIITGNRLETDMFTLTVPDGWEACNAGDCIFMYDNRHQSERLYLFTLRSIKLTGEDFGAFLDKVFGNHAGLKSYTINENEYVYSDVSKGKKTIQVLLKPLGSSFGLMMQCHSQTNRLTSWQKEIVESLKLKPIKETINATK